MVSLRTVAQILFESIGELMIIISALLYTKQYPAVPSVSVVIFLLIGVTLRLTGNEIYSAIKGGNLLKRLFKHFET